MKNLKFPEISKKSQQSIYGAWSGSGSDLTYDGGTFDTVWLAPVSGGGDSSGGVVDYDWGDTFGDDMNDYATSGGGGSAADTSTGGVTQGVDSGVDDWGLQDLFQHYDRGNGEAVTLEQIGLEDDVRNSDTYRDVVEAVKTQIATQVGAYISENSNSGTINYHTHNTYNFTFDSAALFPIGGATIITNSEITITQFGGDEAFWSADIDVNFDDTFGDPWDIANMVQEDWDTGTPFDIGGRWEEAASGILRTP